MNYILTAFLIILHLSVFGQLGNETTKAINQFGMDAYSSKSKESDFLISPLSISSAMAMTYLGSDNKTKKQIEDIFYFSDDSNFLNGFSELMKQFESDNTEISIANKLFPSETQIQLNENFITDNKRYFGTPIEKVNYSIPSEASKKINNWVAENTNNKITDLIDSFSISPDLVLFLVNAIYFKSGWLNEFDSTKTKQGTFVNDLDEQIEVDYMHSTGRYKTYSNRLVDVLDIPYKNDEFSFLVFLPKIPMAELEDLLSIQNYFNWTYSTQYTQINTLRIPKFRVRYHDELKDDLIKMGLPLAFSESAEFHKMGNAGGLIKLSTVVHETYIEFNEEGTEAAAATAVGASARSMPPPPRDFIVDRPFIYLIRHNSTSTILFLGKNSNPKY